MSHDGWSGLFASAFRESRNPMVLVDGDRAIVDANGAFVQLLGRARGELVERPLYGLVADGPLATPKEWRNALAQGRFTGVARLRHSTGAEVPVQWAATTEVATGRRLVLFVALATERWGAHFRRMAPTVPGSGTLSGRQREIVQLVARGESGPEIAAALHISGETVRTHVRNAMNKLGARSRAHLVAKAIGEALIEPDAAWPER